jgi:hypothetical protein
LHQRPARPSGAGQQPGEGSRQSGIKDDGAIGALAGAGEGINDDAKRQGLAPISRLSATAMIKTIKRPGTAKARAAVVETTWLTSLT